MNPTNPMPEFKIYREGRYDRGANIKMKIKNQLPVMIQAIDNFFVNH